MEFSDSERAMHARHSHRPSRPVPLQVSSCDALVRGITGAPAENPAVPIEFCPLCRAMLSIRRARGADEESVGSLSLLSSIGVCSPLTVEESSVGRASRASQEEEETLDESNNEPLLRRPKTPDEMRLTALTLRNMHLNIHSPMGPPGAQQGQQLKLSSFTQTRDRRARHHHRASSSRPSSRTSSRPAGLDGLRGQRSQKATTPARTPWPLDQLIPRFVKDEAFAAAEERRRRQAARNKNLRWYSTVAI